MTGCTPELVAALATADRQLAHADGALDQLIESARTLPAEHAVKMWVALAEQLLGTVRDHPEFAAETLAAAVFRLARTPGGRRGRGDGD